MTYLYAGLDFFRLTSLEASPTHRTAMELLQAAMALLVFALLLGMGATIEVAQLKTTFTAHRRAVIIGFVSQFGLMPLIAFTMAVALDMPNAVGLSMVVIGCTPVRGSPAGAGDPRGDLTGSRRPSRARCGRAAAPPTTSRTCPAATSRCRSSCACRGAARRRVALADARCGMTRDPLRIPSAARSPRPRARTGPRRARPPRCS